MEVVSVYGQSFVLQNASSLPVIRAAVQQQFKIPADCQILLTLGGVQLKPQLLLDNPANLKICAFDRRLLSAEPDARFQQEVLGQSHLAPLQRPFGLEDITNLHNTYQDNKYTHLQQQAHRTVSFIAEAHANYAKTILTISIANLDKISQVHGFIQNILHSRNAAIHSLENHTRTVCDQFENLESKASRDFDQQTSLISDFDTDIMLLHAIRVPVSFLGFQESPADMEDGVHQTVTGNEEDDEEMVRTLAEFVPIDKICAWKDKVSEASLSLRRAFQDMSVSIRNIKDETQELLESSTPTQEFILNDETLKEIRESIRSCSLRIQAETQELERRLENIDPSGDLMLHVFASLEQQLSTLLPTLYKNAQEVYDLTVRAYNDYHATVESLHKTLRNVARIQSQIALLSPHLQTLSAQTKAVSDAFLHILHVHRMPSAFVATVVEIIRRREFNSFFSTKISQIAESIARIRSQEEKKREMFSKEIGRYLPVEISDHCGIKSKPPHVDISVKNDDHVLPEMTREHIPELEGLVTTLEHDLGRSINISRLQIALFKMIEGLQTTDVEKEFERSLVKSGAVRRIRSTSTSSSRQQSVEFNLVRPSTQGSVEATSSLPVPSHVSGLYSTTPDNATLHVSTPQSVSTASPQTVDMSTSTDDHIKGKTKVGANHGVDDEKIHRLYERLCSIQGSLKDLQFAYETMRSNFEHLRLAHDELQIEHSDALHDKTQLVIRARGLEREVSEKEDMISEAEERIRHLEIESVKRVERLEKMRLAQEAKMTEMEKVQREIQDKDRKLQEMLNELSEFKDVRGILDEKDKLLKDANERISEMSEAIQRLTVEKRLKETKLESELSAKGRAMQSTMEDKTTLENEFTELMCRFKDASVAISRLESQKLELSHDLVELRNENEMMRCVDEELVQKNDVLITEKQELEQKHQTEKEDMKARLDKMAAKLNNVTEELETIKTLHSEPVKPISSLDIARIALSYASVLKELNEHAISVSHDHRRLESSSISSPSLPSELASSNGLGKSTIQDQQDHVRQVSTCITDGINLDEIKTRITTLLERLKDNAISFRQFQTGHLMLFIPTKNERHFVAFNVEQKFYILSEESFKKCRFQLEKHKTIMGYLVKCERLVASEPDKKDNPYHLSQGTEYFVCDIDPFPLPL